MTEEAAATDYSGYNTPSSTQIEQPLVVEDAGAFAWDEKCDMLVVGYGLAGASAALKAAELGGLDIVLADRFNGGGTSALSGGVVYAGGGTHVQKQFGIADSAEGLAQYLMNEVGTLRRPETVKRFAASSTQMIDWLEARGVTFDGPVYEKKASYPPPPYFLYYSGNEKVPAFSGQHPPAPRGHRARPSDSRDLKKFSGDVMMAGLKRTVEATPAIRLHLQAAARRLIVDAQGGVIGAELWQIPPGSKAARRHQFYTQLSQKMVVLALGLNGPLARAAAAIERRYAQPVRVLARRGVVLATGGHVDNHRIVEDASPAFAKAMAAGTAGDDGSALRLGQGVGARLGQMHLLSAWRFVSPPMSWIKGIVVDARGQRIVNEECYGARLGDALFEQANGRAWLITDAPVQVAARYELKHDPLWPFQRLPAQFAAMRAKRAATIQELEAKLGFAPGSLVATVEVYNGATQSGAPDAFGKSDQFRTALATGPFYAMDISYDAPLNPVGAITLGGLDVDEDTAGVRNVSGEPIAGLYAVGRSAVGLCSENYISGLSLADCVWSGWQAAETIAGNARGDN